MTFKKARKEKLFARIALVGISGSGKTRTALRMANVLKGDKRIALIDTEFESASLYAGSFDFDTMQLTDYNPKNYIAAIKEASESGEYGCLIIDSLSHAWEGKGGALDIKDKIERRGGAGVNSYTAWREVTPLHNDLVEAILRAPMNVIVTMRSKQDISMEKGENGRTKIVKHGTKAIQREGMEYEFTVVADLDQDHYLTVGKTRIDSLDQYTEQRAGEAFAQQILDFMMSGEGDAPTIPNIPTLHTRDELLAFARQQGLNVDMAALADILRSGGYNTSFTNEAWPVMTEIVLRAAAMAREQEAVLNAQDVPLA